MKAFGFAAVIAALTLTTAYPARAVDFTSCAFGLPEAIGLSCELPQSVGYNIRRDGGSGDSASGSGTGSSSGANGSDPGGNGNGGSGGEGRGECSRD